MQSTTTRTVPNSAPCNPSKVTVVDTQWGEADRKWGYRFGCEGLINLKGAAALLGGCSARTVERRLSEGVIRAGKDGGRLVICRRSLMEYIGELEQ